MKRADEGRMVWTRWAGPFTLKQGEGPTGFELGGDPGGSEFCPLWGECWRECGPADPQVPLAAARVSTHAPCARRDSHLCLLCTSS